MPQDRERLLLVVGFFGLALLVHGVAKLIHVQSEIWWTLEPWLFLAAFFVLLSRRLHRERIASGTGTPITVGAILAGARAIAWPVVVGIFGCVLALSLAIRWVARASGVIPSTPTASYVDAAAFGLTLFVFGLASPYFMRERRIERPLSTRMAFCAAAATAGATWWWWLVFA
jgi:hypothetical protein